MFFTGQHPSNKRVAIRGRSAGEESREQILERTRLEREKRQLMRLQNKGATVIQVWTLAFGWGWDGEAGACPLRMHGPTSSHPPCMRMYPCLPLQAHWRRWRSTRLLRQRLQQEWRSRYGPLLGSKCAAWRIVCSCGWGVRRACSGGMHARWLIQATLCLRPTGGTCAFYCMQLAAIMLLAARCKACIATCAECLAGQRCPCRTPPPFAPQGGAAHGVAAGWRMLGLVAAVC